MRWAASWTLYWLGDAASKLFTLIPDRCERTGWVAYQVYSGLMMSSVKIQGDGEGPWLQVE